MRFANSYLLYFIPLIVLGFWILFQYSVQQKKKAISLFAKEVTYLKITSGDSLGREKIKQALFLFSLLFFLIALARPQFGTKMETLRRTGVDVMVAVDTSQSMMAEDIKPNRLEKAKHQIMTLIDKLEGDRIGIVAFSGIAFVQCPLTLDYMAASFMLNQLDIFTIPKPGTAISQAIIKGVDGFHSSDKKYKVMILMTDGEDHEENLEKAIEYAKDNGVIIYTIGIGSREGVPIPQYDRDMNRTGLKKDRNGEIILTKMDYEALQKISLETNGKFYASTSGEMELERIYSDIKKMDKKELLTRRYTQYEDRFQIFVFIGLIFLFWFSILGDVRPRMEVN